MIVQSSSHVQPQKGAKVTKEIFKLSFLSFLCLFVAKLSSGSYATEPLGDDNMPAIKNKVNTNLTKKAAKFCHTIRLATFPNWTIFSQTTCAESAFVMTSVRRGHLR
jgi:hypothetical protein